jgi:hypothetical protein
MLTPAGFSIRSILLSCSTPQVAKAPLDVRPRGSFGKIADGSGALSADFKKILEK